MQSTLTPATMAAEVSGKVVTLVASDTSIVLDFRSGGIPRVLYWGRDLGIAADKHALHLPRACEPSHVDNLIDTPISVSILPEAHTGWMGKPGICGSRGGRQWATAFTGTRGYVSGIVRTSCKDSITFTGRSEVAIDAKDEDSELAIRINIEMTDSGLVRTQACLTNLSHQAFSLESLDLALPVPPRASELLDFAGRWSYERIPQRSPFTVGRHSRENRRGRTGADASIVTAAGTPGFGFARGEIWCIHVAWSGNHQECAEHTSDGYRLLRGGELLLPGEIRLKHQEEYESPVVIAGWGEGLDAVAARFHDNLRTRPGHPVSPRPVNMNVWEAVYFEHDPTTLIELARAGAEIGVERFVLDDGWFKGRRNARTGLGDWAVDTTAWPAGLRPLADEVHRLNMEFGLWFEPEMVNLDSDLARTRPEWVMHARESLPPASRHQHVLDLTNEEAYSFIRDQMIGVIRDNDVDYIKWDQNRDFIEAGRSGRGGEPAVHLHTLAVYRLMDELKRCFPTLEIESCSSGGARMDLGVIQHSDRVWASDCIDPLERQHIQRWTSQLLPLELIGAHVASERSHTTGRKHSLSFRAQTALFGHFGIELDIRQLSGPDRSELTEWVRIYRSFRALLHSGRLIRDSDSTGDRIYTGVMAHDKSEGLFSIVSLARTPDDPPGPLPLRGTDPRMLYTVTPIHPQPLTPEKAPAWWPTHSIEPFVAPGSVIGEIGLSLPALNPETCLLLHLQQA